MTDLAKITDEERELQIIIHDLYKDLSVIPFFNNALFFESFDQNKNNHSILINGNQRDLDSLRKRNLIYSCNLSLDCNTKIDDSLSYNTSSISIVEQSQDYLASFELPSFLDSSTILNSKYHSYSKNLDSVVPESKSLDQFPPKPFIQTNSTSSTNNHIYVSLRSSSNDSKKRQFIEIFDSFLGCIKSIEVTDKHGAFYVDDTFGNVSISKSGTKICYVAESIVDGFTGIGIHSIKSSNKTCGSKNCKTNNKQVNQSNINCKSPFSQTELDPNQYVYREDWGERFTGRNEPRIFVLDLISEEIFSLITLKDYSPCQPIFGPNDNTIIYRGLKTDPMKYGIVYCHNRPASIFQQEICDDSGESIKMLSCSNKAARSPILLKSGKGIVYLSIPVGGPHNTCAQLLKYTFPDEKKVNLVKRGNNVKKGIVIYDNEEDNWTNIISTSDIPCGCINNTSNIKGYNTEYSMDIIKNTTVVIDYIEDKPLDDWFYGFYSNRLYDKTSLISGKDIVFTTTSNKCDTIVVAVDIDSKNVYKISSDYKSSNILGGNENWLVVTESDPATPQCIKTIKIDSILLNKRKKSNNSNCMLTIPNIGSKSPHFNNDLGIDWEIQTNGPIESIALYPKTTNRAKKIISTKNDTRYTRPIKYLSFEDWHKQESTFVGGTDSPLLVCPHGGPHSCSSTDFSLNNAILVRLGISLVMPNYTGSTGFGRKFVNALVGKIGTNDIVDVIDVIEFNKKEGFNNIGISGGSHGGFITAWVSTKQIDLKCAVLRNPVIHLGVVGAQGDIPDWAFAEAGVRWDMESPPPFATECEYKVLLEKSPISSVKQIGKFPSLIMLGSIDRRVPNYDGRLWARAIGPELSRVLIFPGEGHPLSGPSAEIASGIASAAFVASRFKLSTV